jgi:hypothetical protein
LGPHICSHPFIKDIGGLNFVAPLMAVQKEKSWQKVSSAAIGKQKSRKPAKPRSRQYLQLRPQNRLQPPPAHPKRRAESPNRAFITGGQSDAAGETF